jgi:serine/threonine protein phosphatase PrpC
VKIDVEVAARTDVGLKRKNNEDNYGFDTDLGVLVLCDGMGGAAAGEVASRLAVQCVLDYFRHSKEMEHFPPASNMPGASTAGAVLGAIAIANTAIREAGLNNSRQMGMGSTIVVALVRDSVLTIGHVGDSRAYLLHENRLRQLTEDHSLVAEQLRRGFISSNEAAGSALKNIVTRALGIADNVEADVQELAITPGDVLLLACDGLTKVVSDDQIASIVARNENLEKAAAMLVESAKEKQSDDNITCVLARFRKRSWFHLGRIANRTEGPV